MLLLLLSYQMSPKLKLLGNAPNNVYEVIQCPLSRAILSCT